MVANYGQRIKDWYQRFANGMNDGFDQSDYDNLKAEWNDIVNDALAERDAMKDMFGWYGSTSQDSTKKGFQAMSQDMGEELNGRFTAVQESNEVIKEQSIMQTEFLSLISEDMSSVKREIEMRGTQISELLDIQYQSLEHLSEIRRSTAQLYQMNERLGKIESNTNKL